VRAGAGHESHPQGGLVLGTHPTAQKHATGAGGRRHAHVDGAGSSNLHTLTFPDFVSLTCGPASDGPHLPVTQSQGRLSRHGAPDVAFLANATSRCLPSHS
jgi:hypothetical protein